MSSARRGAAVTHRRPKQDTTDWGVRDAKRRLQLEEFLRYGSSDRRWSPATQRVYGLWVAKAMEWMVANGRPHLAEASRRDVRDFYSQTLNTIPTRKLVGKALRAYFDWLQDEEVREDNPAQRLPRLPTPKRVPRTLSQSQALAVLKAAREDGPRTYAAVCLMLYAGLRASEVCGLPWGAVEGDGQWLRVLGKGNAERALPMHEAVLGALVTWQADAPMSRWMFPSQRNEDRHMHYESLRAAMKRIGTAAGVPELTAHKLRHTYGTTLMNATGDLALTQDALGHSSPATTRIYATVRPQRLATAVKALDFGTLTEIQGVAY